MSFPDLAPLLKLFDALPGLDTPYQAGLLLFAVFVLLSYRFFTSPETVLLKRVAIAIFLVIAFVPTVIWVVFSQLTGRGMTLPFLMTGASKHAKNLFIDFRSDKTDPDLFDERRAIEEMDRFGADGDWQALHDLLRDNDRRCAATPTGYAINQTLLDHLFQPFDVMRDAAYEGGFDINLDTLRDNVQPYRDRFEAQPDDYIAAALCARAHVAAGWAARGEISFDMIKPQNLEAFLAHFSEANRILHRFPAREYDSALLAHIDYELCIGSPHGAEEIRAKFTTLQRLDPANPRIYTRHGLRLLPRWFGDYPELDATARALAAQTEPLFGKGAYALTYLTALEYDEEAQAKVDPELFIEAVEDFVTYTGTQMAVNLMAHRLMTVRETTETGPLRTAIDAYVPALLKEELLYVLPELWENMDARSIRGMLSLMWMDVLETGKQVHYTSTGVKIREADAV
ncbi:MAG: hypothetical protein HWE33_06965 [Rhodobacteraceae bacterium]|nr:hypothetical protein [Paracoccaceae bacterium]